MGKLTSGKKSRKKARKIGLLELTFYVFSRILNLQIHAHIYRSFIRHHKMLGVRIAKRKIEPQKPANPCDTRLCSCIFSVVNDPTQFEQVDETCEFGGAVLYSESLGITAFFENVVPSKYETQKLKQLQFGIENEKIRQFEHECLIRLFQWSFLPPGKALDFSVCDEAFGCYKTQYRKRYLLEICQNASFLSTPDTRLQKPMAFGGCPLPQLTNTAVPWYNKTPK